MLRVLAVLGVIVSTAPSLAAEVTLGMWDYDGSEVELIPDGKHRELRYVSPAPDLPISAGAVLFRGERIGNTYSGTAYAFSSGCDPSGYDVTGTLSENHDVITLEGKRPIQNESCEVVGSEDNTLVLRVPEDSGCDGGTETDADDATQYAQNYEENTNAGEGTSCPILYYWDAAAKGWEKYGKVIHEARNSWQKGSQRVGLDKLSLTFRLAEEEPEQSFIERLQLEIVTNDESVFVLTPVEKSGSAINRTLFIEAYHAHDFSFQLPKGVERRDVKSSSLTITGYYERLSKRDQCLALKSMPAK